MGLLYKWMVEGLLITEKAPERGAFSYACVIESLFKSATHSPCGSVDSFIVS